jgi:CBS domain containing-hemolysin-like protein
MPYVGEVVEIDALSFEVLEVERRRVTKIRARRRKDAAATAE